MTHDDSAAEGTNVAENWLTMLDEHSMQFVVLDSHSDGELLSLVRSRPCWSVNFEDGKAVVLARTEHPGCPG